MAKVVKVTIGIVVSLIVVAGGAAYSVLSLSKPTLSGVLSADVSGPTTLVRDQQGIATITGPDRLSVSYSLGYAHAQERFFQMDLLRRNSAGELSELFGPIALDHDKSVRLHQFRLRANYYLKNLTAQQTAILERYALGVNQGLADLSTQPFEYYLLNVIPTPWRAEDSLLVLYSMYLDLQYKDGRREHVLGLMKNALADDLYAFLNPRGSKWDAAVDGTSYPASPIPNSTMPQVSSRFTSDTTTAFSLFEHQHEEAIGSNNWAVSGNVTATGSAIVADDMHLNIAVPNIWYRAGLRFVDHGQTIRVDGVTLPGTPAIVVGSNEHIAWGFTNSYGDWSDIINLRVSDDGEQYLTPDGYQTFDKQIELIKVKGQEPVSYTVKRTVWGPVIRDNESGAVQAYRWVAHDPQGINFNLLNMELAKSVNDAIDVAHSAGIPAQNLMVGDRNGNIGWTIAGAIPRKYSPSGNNLTHFETPQDWSTGATGWRDYLPSAEYPVVINPENQVLWTANSRVIGDQMLQIVGNGGYALGARSQQIRDGLLAHAASGKPFTEQTLLDIQNDDRALFLTPWQQFISHELLTDSLITKHKWQELAKHINNWQGRASTDSVSYLLVRTFRLKVRDLVFSDLQQVLQQQDASASLRPIRHQLEVPLWQLITEQPAHLLPSPYTAWSALFEQAMLDTVAELEQQHGSLAKATWGAHNTTHIQHPLAKAIPALGWLLDMPKAPANGDSYMPRVQGVSFGSSQRMSASPSHEQHAIFHMPSSQSGHPLSPYYGVGHAEWLEGKATSLLAGEPKTFLEFLPK